MKDTKILGNCEHCGIDYQLEVDQSEPDFGQAYDAENEVWGYICPSCEQVSQNWEDFRIKVGNAREIDETKE